VPYWWQRERSNFKQRIFGNFCPNFPLFLAQPVTRIPKSRQFLDGLCTVVQGEFSAGIALPFVGDAFVF